MATDIIARGMITEYKSGTNISFKENEDGSVTISASGDVSSEDTVARETIDNHKLDKNNPHNVTAEQVGLNNVDNTADLDKPISTAVQTALDDKANAKHTHKKSDITDFPNSLPANGGNADTVNNHTVDSDVPDGAVFTDTVYDDTDIRAEIANKADTTSIPSKVSVLENDSKYQTESDVTTTLADYATKTYVGAQVANAEHLKREIVTVLPSDEEASDNVIYMLKVESATGNDKYQEYMKIDGTVQMIGDTSVNLTDYAKSADIPTTLPANGGNADTVNNHTVKSDVPENAVFTDTIYDDTELNAKLNGKADKNAVLNSLEIVNGYTTAQIIPWNDGTHYRSFEDKSSNTYTDIVTNNGIAIIARTENGVMTKNAELATMDKVAHEVDTSYMSNGILNILAIKESLGNGCYEIMGQGSAGHGSIRLNIWQVVSGVTAFSCCITDSSGVRGICGNEVTSTTVDVGTSYFATTNKIIKIF